MTLESMIAELDGFLSLAGPASLSASPGPRLSSSPGSSTRAAAAPLDNKVRPISEGVPGHLLRASTVSFGTGPLGLGLGANNNFDPSGSSVFSTSVERFNLLPDGSTGPAQAARCIAIGDFIVAVNKESTAGLDYGHVMARIKASRRPVLISFAPCPSSDQALVDASRWDAVPADSSPQNLASSTDFIDLVQDELGWARGATLLTAEEVIDRACDELGIDAAGMTMHAASTHVARELGISRQSDASVPQLDNSTSQLGTITEESSMVSPRSPQASPTTYRPFDADAGISSDVENDMKDSNTAHSAAEQYLQQRGQGNHERSAEARSLPSKTDVQALNQHGNMSNTAATFLQRMEQHEQKKKEALERRRMLAAQRANRSLRDRPRISESSNRLAQKVPSEERERRRIATNHDNNKKNPVEVNAVEAAASLRKSVVLSQAAEQFILRTEGDISQRLEVSPGVVDLLCLHVYANNCLVCRTSSC